jgi:hypothetical protein
MTAYEAEAHQNTKKYKYRSIFNIEKEIKNFGLLRENTTRHLTLPTRSLRP